MQHVQDAAYALQLAMLLDGELGESYDPDLCDMVDFLLLASAEPLTKRFKTAVGQKKLSVQRLRQETAAVVGDDDELVNRHIRLNMLFQ